MARRTDIHPLALRHLRELRERGAEPTVEEALRLVYLCERVADPHADGRLEHVGIPVRCGASDEWLWPLTIGAAVWYRELACPWWEGEGERLFWALAFALAHARDKAALTACRTREAAERMILDWSLSLCCTRAELEQAVDEALPPPAPAEPGGVNKGTDWGWIVGTVEAVTGIPCDHWLWEVSRDETIRAWYRARQVSAARVGGSAPEAPSAEDEALLELAQFKAGVVRRAAGG
jgi:hypothetical protein